jgi:hypothetical protein
MIWESRVTDAGLRNLSDLRNLKHLDVQMTQVTDDGLVFLYGLTNLRSFNWQNTKITTDGVSRLKRVLPSLRS